MKKTLLLLASTLVFAQSDTTPPVLKSITFQPDTIKTIDSSANFTITAVANDDISGIKWIRVNFRSHSDNLRITNDLWPSAQDNIDSNGDRTFVAKSSTVPRFSESGDWRVNKHVGPPGFEPGTYAL